MRPYPGNMSMEYADYVQQLSNDHPELAREVAAFHTMESVLKWLDYRGLSVADMDVIQQDEFSHDVLIPLGGQDRYLVFGIT